VPEELEALRKTDLPAEIDTPQTAVSVAEPDPAPAPAKPNRGGVAKKIARIIVMVIVLLLGWYIASDQLAPSSTVGAVTAFTTQVAPRVAGEVTEVLVQDNQAVEQGDVLFKLDPRPFDLAVRQAQANLAQVVQGTDASMASLSASKARVEQSQAVLESTRANVERSRELLARGLNSQAQADKGEADLSAALASLQMAEADYLAADLKAGGGGSANPQVEAAQVQLEQALLNAEFATITAPRAGVITNLRLAVGQFIGAGTPSMTFIANEQPWIMADFREGQLAGVEIGNSVGILFDAQPGVIHAGRVQGIAWGIDPGRTSANGLPQNQPSTRWFEPARTIPVHIELDEGADWPRNVRVGSKVSVVIYAGGYSNPVAWIASGLHHVKSYLSFLF
jgi:multidrug resistance efflux pump